ncbi:hypothetical protein BH20ACT11_BH20ACT11_02260 [soil metagenome]|jgi:uncharacterized Tic20 family protein
MSEEQRYGDPNYGTVGEQGAQGGAPAGGIGGTVVSSGNERAWGALAHLSIFVNIFTVILGPVISFVIWLVYRDRSREIAFQALQSMWYQIAWFVALAAGWAVAGVLTAVLIGFLLMPFLAILTLVPFVHSAYGAYKIGKGEEFRYPIIADMIDGR